MHISIKKPLPNAGPLQGSAVYQGQLVHLRHLAPTHQFKYAMRLMLVDLDELPSLIGNTKFWSMRGGIANFDRRNFVPNASLDIKSAIIGEIQAQLSKQFCGTIFMLAAPKFLGIGFNPLTLFYCFAQDKLQYIVAEVRNTPWMERHCYVLDMTSEASLTHDKTFHVSPFMDMQQKYQWTLPVPDEKLQVVIRNIKDGQLTFMAALNLTRTEPLSARVLDRELFTHWPQALKTVIGIYWQAVKLLIKGARFYGHPRSHSATTQHDTTKENLT